ncbi:homoserine kinase [Campylobacter geochelonis]|uniref:Homoserine kinase n=1 Tax=Campylobacter geochelonis TaxID=1780362 RepID=A0A128ELM7_9BACT|nr:homoserine kinase [Campylobacter geochelonis]QKF70724.1 homoserine kinase [Campylobacter geochelonis]CZE47239.1 homoserine kinase [Campylobacter geochelonis]CZE49421.1 homoserine kinase [Campylobacter geochelonis]
MKIIVPATSANLGPGFDALGLSLKLYNEIEITPQSFTCISIKGEGSKKNSIKKNNSFVNIFNEIYLSLVGKTDDFKFSFTNNIPFSRGLGSSSSVVIGAIAAAYEMAGFKVDRNTILNKAVFYENHPDNIAPATFGGFTSSIIENSKVYTQKANLSDDIKAVVVIPDKAMSTNDSRNKLPKHYSMKDTVSNLAHAAFLTSCFIKQDYDSLRIASKDMMHENLRMQSLPELFDVRNIAYKNGALMSTLSGSGSTFLNIAYKKDAPNLQKQLAENFKDFRVEILDFDNDGFKIISKS